MDSPLPMFGSHLYLENGIIFLKIFNCFKINLNDLCMFLFVTILKLSRDVWYCL